MYTKQPKKLIIMYKDAESIINAIGDTVRIDKQIKPIYNFKSSDRFRSKK